MGLKARLKEIAVSKIIAYLLKRLAEGGFGGGPKAAYWWLAGKKTYIAAALAIATYGLSYLSDHGVCPPCASYNTYLLALAGFLASIGLIDGALRTDPPKP